MKEISRSQVNGSITPFATVPQHVLCERIQDELILLDLNAGQYYSLNEVGSRMWVLIQEKGDLDEVLTAMLEEYDVARDRLQADLLKFVDGLTSQGFIQVSNGNSS